MKLVGTPAGVQDSFNGLLGLSIAAGGLEVAITSENLTSLLLGETVGNANKENNRVPWAE